MVQVYSTTKIQHFTSPPSDSEILYKISCRIPVVKNLRHHSKSRIFFQDGFYLPLSTKNTNNTPNLVTVVLSYLFLASTSDGSAGTISNFIPIFILCFQCVFIVFSLCLFCFLVFNCFFTVFSSCFLVFLFCFLVFSCVFIVFFVDKLQR